MTDRGRSPTRTQSRDLVGRGSSPASPSQRLVDFDEWEEERKRKSKSRERAPNRPSRSLSPPSKHTSWSGPPSNRGTSPTNPAHFLPGSFSERRGQSEARGSINSPRSARDPAPPRHTWTKSHSYSEGASLESHLSGLVTCLFHPR